MLWLHGRFNFRQGAAPSVLCRDARRGGRSENSRCSLWGAGNFLHVAWWLASRLTGPECVKDTLVELSTRVSEIRWPIADG